jgi:catechol 2,3-dioxygenase-like lactoylglutathione lyase family enzyme
MADASAYLRFRSARPTDRLPALRRFYVDGLGLDVLGEWLDHEGFDGLVVGDGRWEVEFVHEHDQPAPAVPGPEHLLVFYLADREALEARAAAMDRAGFARATPNNPYWARCGVTYTDPDGYAVVIAVPPGP